MYVLLAATTLGGCGSLRPVAPVVDAPGGVRVLVRALDDDLFALEVVNYGRAPIVVDRDRVVLVTASGTRARARRRLAPRRDPARRDRPSSRISTTLTCRSSPVFSC